MYIRSLRAAVRARLCVVAALGLAIAVSGVSDVLATTKQFRAKTAERLVNEALHREVFGLSDERQQLLAEATRQLPDFAPAMWHQGYVRSRDKWVKIDDADSLSQNKDQLREYQRARNQFPQNAAGQLALANWCRDRGLQAQERAHLTRVLDLEADNAEALLRLGFRPVNGTWVSLQELAEQEKQIADNRRSLAIWRPQIEDVRNGLSQRSSRKVQAAAERLKSITDPAAIPAIEQLLADNSPFCGSLVVETFAGMNETQATMALARQAVFSQWPEVRELAARKLRGRSVDSFVPLLLSSMSSPITSRTLTIPANGRMNLFQTFTREGQDEREELVMQARNSRLPSVADVHFQNLRIESLNARIAGALNIVTEQTLTADPQEWWTWWNETNEVFVEGEKPLRSIGDEDQLARIEQARELEELQRLRESAARNRQLELERARSQSQAPRRRDCLAAGTQIWTATGPVAVEKIRVGDLVLAQHPDTGELAYQPVLRTTIRPVTTLVRIRAGGETIEASGGHPFWVAGEGWVKARDLKPGMELHGVTSTSRIVDVQDGQEAQSFNLIVADFSSYFVGSNKILSHDNSIRDATDAIVPGLFSE